MGRRGSNDPGVHPILTTLLACREGTRPFIRTPKKNLARVRGGKPVKYGGGDRANLTGPWMIHLGKAVADMNCLVLCHQLSCAPCCTQSVTQGEGECPA